MKLIENIDEKNMLQQETKDQLEFLRSLINTIPNPVFYKNKNLVFQGCNVAFETLLNISEKDLIGKTDSDIFDSEIASEILKKDNTLVKTLETQKSIFDLQTNKGIRNIIQESAPHLDSSGEFDGIIGILFDFTEQNFTKQGLKQKIDLLKLAPVSAFIITIYGKIIYWNIGAEELYGISAHKVIDKNIKDLVEQGVLTEHEYNHIANIQDATLETGYWEGKSEFLNRRGVESIVENKTMISNNRLGYPEFIMITELDITANRLNN